jgi:hypothetical protein
MPKADPAQQQIFYTFSSVLDQSAYDPLPDNWLVGMTDIVDSSHFIEEGRYHDVNFVGASIIAALGNSLSDFEFPFTFGGDGSTFALPPDSHEKATIALRQVQHFAKRAFGLSMRVGLFSVRQIRAAGFDVRIARYAASESAIYTMFSGGGVKWVEGQLKLGGFTPAYPEEECTEPDLSGLSCNWSPFASTNGVVLSLLVEPRDVSGSAFAEFVKLIVSIFDKTDSNGNPLPSLPPARRDGTVAVPSPVWSDIVSNSDFRKFDDALRLTVDCSAEQLASVERLLAVAALKRHIAYGIHLQTHALLTCLVPSSGPAGHRHFLDGADGGYARAATMLKATTQRSPSIPAPRSKLG